MKLTVNNLGAIKKGTIDLDKSVYLFVGYNNSGKTYMSKLIFTIFHNDTMQGFPNEELVAKIGNLVFENKINLTNELVKNLLDGFAKHVESKFLKALNLTKDQPAFRNFSLSFDFIEEEITDHSFSLNSQSVINGKEYSIFSLQKERGTSEILYKEHSLNNILTELKDEEIALVENAISEGKDSRNVSNKLILFLLRSLLSNEKEPIFFPSDRVFYLKHKRSIFSEEYERKKNTQLRIQELIEQAGEQANDKILKELLNLLKPSFTNAEDILIRKIVGLEDSFLKSGLSSKADFTSIVSDLEKIMGGEVILKRVDLPTGEKEVEYAFKFDISPKESDELPLALSSSAVNQLSTLYLLLKYSITNRPAFIFIDEPEENLHPQNQIKLLNLLLEFASMNNNRLLITTHSTLLAEHLNNYLGMAYLKEKGKEVSQNGIISKSVNFDLDNTGVYFFGNNRIAPYDFEEYGVTFSDFNRVVRNIREVNSSITNQIYELNNQE